MAMFRRILVANRTEEKAERLPKGEERFTDDEAFRPVFPIDEAWQLALALRGRAAGVAPRGGRSEARLALEGGWFDGGAGVATRGT